MQRGVGVDHPDQRHVGEVEPLGDHLGAEQDPDLARLERGEHLLVAAVPAHRVRIHPPDRLIGERGADLALEPLGADPAIIEQFPAGRAGRETLALGVAEVADELPAPW